MKFVIKVFLLILFIFSQQCFSYAKDIKVLVLPDTLAKKEQDTFIYAEAADLISNDVINYLNNINGFNAPTISYIKQIVSKDDKFKRFVQSTMFEFKNTYNVDYMALKQINTKFGANWIMLITSNMDVQNYFLRRTVWDFLNIPGAAVVDPAIRLSTQVYIIDPAKQTIVWQNNYQKLISSRENRIIATNFQPQTEQMEWIKRHSRMYLAPQIIQEMQFIAYNVDEYSNYFKHPEIVKTNPLVVDSAKLNAQRGAVIAGRGTKRYGARAGRATKRGVKKAVNKTKTGIKNQKSKFKAKRQESKQKRQLKRAEKQAQKAKKQAEKAKQKLQDATENLNDLRFNQPREVDVIMIKEEPPIDYDFTPTKPRLREDNDSMFNDL
ncbi:hypothetical protein IJ818_02700 [bacterium]|nr:hypothetical protein [bacterium]